MKGPCQPRPGMLYQMEPGDIDDQQNQPRDAKGTLEEEHQEERRRKEIEPEAALRASVGKPQVIQQRDEREKHGLLEIAFPARLPGERQAEDAEDEDSPVYPGAQILKTVYRDDDKERQHPANHAERLEKLVFQGQGGVRCQPPLQHFQNGHQLVFPAGPAPTQTSVERATMFSEP